MSHPGGMGACEQETVGHEWQAVARGKVVREAMGKGGSQGEDR